MAIQSWTAPQLNPSETPESYYKNKYPGDAPNYSPQTTGPFGNYQTNAMQTPFSSGHLPQTQTPQAEMGSNNIAGVRGSHKLDVRKDPNYTGIDMTALMNPMWARWFDQVAAAEHPTDESQPLNQLRNYRV